MSLFEFIVCVLATWQAILIWRKGSLFADYRAILELQANLPAKLLTCSFCLSPWIAFICCLLVMMFRDFWIFSILQLPVYALAVARASNISHDLFLKYDQLNKDTQENPVNNPQAEESTKIENDNPTE